MGGLRKRRLLSKKAHIGNLALYMDPCEQHKMSHGLPCASNSFRSVSAVFALQTYRQKMETAANKEKDCLMCFGNKYIENIVQKDGSQMLALYN